MRSRILQSRHTYTRSAAQERTWPDSLTYDRTPFTVLDKVCPQRPCVEQNCEGRERLAYPHIFIQSPRMVPETLRKQKQPFNVQYLCIYM